MRKIPVAAGLGLMALAGVAKWGIAPGLTQRIPPGWEWSAHFVGTQALPDEQGNSFAREATSLYLRRARPVAGEKRPGAVTMEDSFTIMTPAEKKVVWEYLLAVEVDPRTGRHLKPEWRGDQFVFPRFTEKKGYRLRNNYVKGVLLGYQGEERVKGVVTYLFSYKGRGEYTESYGGSAKYPGVKVGPGEEINCADDQFLFRVWVEPVTGEIVKLQESCAPGDYIHDIATGRRLAPVLRWSGITAGDDVLRRAEGARRERLRILFVTRWLPLALLLSGIACIGLGAVGRRHHADKDDIRRHGSLAVRWMTLQIASFALVFLFVSLMQYGAIKEEIYGEIEATGRLAGQIFREALAEHPHFFSPETLLPLLLRLAGKIDNISDIEVMDGSGRIVADSDMDEIGNVVHDRGITGLLAEYGESFRIVEDAGHRHLRVAMSLEGDYDAVRKSDIVGVIMFDLEVERADARVRTAFIRAMLGTLLFLAALWGAGHFLVTRLFIRRMENIKEAAHRLGEGDYSARAPQGGSDELAILATTFNEMADGLQKSNARLESANVELRDFAFIVSHDLKAPLRAIGSLAGWLATDYADRLDGAGKECLELLVNRVKRMLDLIDGVLNYSRAGRLMEEKVKVDLNGLVRRVVDSLESPEHIRITVSPLPTVLCERTKMEQLFQNLIGNAVKFMGKPNGEIGIGCLEEGEASGDWWTFHVSDNGPGIEEIYFDKIFEMFQTLQPRDKVERSGVGLAVVKKIVEGFGGRIWVESRVGEGTTFRFTLPKGAEA